MVYNVVGILDIKKVTHTLAGWASTPNITSLEAAIFKYCESASSGLRPLKTK